MSPHLSPHLLLIAQLEPNTRQIPHFLDHTPGHPGSRALRLGYRPFSARALVWLGVFCLGGVLIYLLSVLFCLELWM